MNKISEIFNKPIFNIILILFSLGISLVLITSADLFTSSGLGGFLLVGKPIIIAVFGLGFYFVSRFLTKKKNWIISFVCIFYLLYLSIDYYLK